VREGSQQEAKNCLWPIKKVAKCSEGEHRMSAANRIIKFLVQMSTPKSSVRGYFTIKDGGIICFISMMTRSWEQESKTAN